MANHFDKYKKFLEDKNPGECQSCGGFLNLEKVNLEDYQGGKLYMMEGVPAYVCQECGEVWVPEPIMNEFEKMIAIAKHRKPRRKGTNGRPRKSKKRGGKTSSRGFAQKGVSPKGTSVRGKK